MVSTRLKISCCCVKEAKPSFSEESGGGGGAAAADKERHNFWMSSCSLLSLVERTEVSRTSCVGAHVVGCVGVCACPLNSKNCKMGQVSLISFICVDDRLTSWHCASQGIDGGDTGVVLMLPVVVAVEEEAEASRRKDWWWGGEKEEVGLGRLVWRVRSSWMESPECDR